MFGRKKKEPTLHSDQKCQICNKRCQLGGTFCDACYYTQSGTSYIESVHQQINDDLDSAIKNQHYNQGYREGWNDPYGVLVDREDRLKSAPATEEFEMGFLDGQGDRRNDYLGPLDKPRRF